MKKSIVVIIAIVLFSITAAAGSSYKFYKKVVKRNQVGKVREYWCEDLTYEILAERNGDIVIEKIIGTVIDKQKNGKIMGVEAGHDYISYKRVKGAKKGDTILTICIYNPDNGYCDDILERFDYIIDRRK